MNEPLSVEHATEALLRVGRVGRQQTRTSDGPVAPWGRGGAHERRRPRISRGELEILSDPEAREPPALARGVRHGSRRTARESLSASFVSYAVEVLPGAPLDVVRYLLHLALVADADPRTAVAQYVSRGDLRVTSLELGSKYTRPEITAAFGGSPYQYLPTKEGRALYGCIQSGDEPAGARGGLRGSRVGHPTTGRDIRSAGQRSDPRLYEGSPEESGVCRTLPM